MCAVMAKRLVIYHAGCPDGMGAALAVRLSALHDVTYLACNYSDQPPDVSAFKSVYVLDFSFSAEILDAWEAHGKTVVVIDHHKTAAHIAERWGCIFDQAKSGAVIAWEYFHPDEPVPLFFHYIQDRDLWRWELADSRAFSAGLWARPKDLETWYGIFDLAQRDGCQSLIRAGIAILDYQKQIVEAHVKQAVDARAFGLPDGVPVVNATTLTSEIGNALLAAFPEAPFVAIYKDVPGKRLWSLRSEDHRADVSEVAKARGGGGHRNAAGYAEQTLHAVVYRPVVQPAAADVAVSPHERPKEPVIWGVDVGDMK